MPASLAERAGIFGQKPAPLAKYGPTGLIKIRPYGPHQDTALRALSRYGPNGPYYTGNTREYREYRGYSEYRDYTGIPGIPGILGIHGNTGNTGIPGIPGTRVTGEAGFWTKSRLLLAKRGLFCALRAQKQLNQVVLDSLDPEGAGSGDVGAGSGDEGDGSVVHGSVSFVDGSVDFVG